jgi:hypothetical protein
MSAHMAAAHAGMTAPAHMGTATVMTAAHMRPATMVGSSTTFLVVLRERRRGRRQSECKCAQNQLVHRFLLNPFDALNYRKAA